MRLLVAAAALLVTLVTPAAAQRIDATRSQGGIARDRAWCNFEAYPELRLTHDPNGGRAFATWDQQAREHRPNAGRYIDLVVMFTPGADGHAPASATALFAVRIEGRPFARQIASARALADGKDTGIPLQIEGEMRMDPGSTSALRLTPALANGPRLAALLAAARVVRLDLLDERGALIEAFHWDLPLLHEAPRVLAIADWKCGDAVNR
ncbi:MAG: hypothetical protein V4574_14885 [Pseudomonadota bacterium]